MGIKLSESNVEDVKKLMNVAAAFADQLYLIMEHNGLVKVPGAAVSISVEPGLRFTTKNITFGHRGTDAGYVLLAKGRYDEEFEAYGNENSTEYEILFAKKELRERILRYIGKEKPVCPDGLWIGDDRNDPPLDCYGREIRFDDLPVRGAINT